MVAGSVRRRCVGVGWLDLLDCGSVVRFGWKAAGLAVAVGALEAHLLPAALDVVGSGVVIVDVDVGDRTPSPSGGMHRLILRAGIIAQAPVVRVVGRTRLQLECRPCRTSIVAKLHRARVTARSLQQTARAPLPGRLRRSGAAGRARVMPGRLPLLRVRPARPGASPPVPGRWWSRSWRSSCS